MRPLFAFGINVGIDVPPASRAFCVQVKQESGALTWPNGADLDPGWLHAELVDKKTWSVPFDPLIELEFMPSQTAAQENSAFGIIPSAPWRIQAVSVLPDLKLAITFRDGSGGIVDCSNTFDY